MLAVVLASGCFVDRTGLRAPDGGAPPPPPDADVGTDGGGGGEDAETPIDGGPPEDGALPPDDGGVDPPDGGAALRIVAVAAGGLHTLALRSDGVVFCWGHNNDGQCGVTPTDRISPTRVPLTGTPIGIAAGDLFSCVLATDGAVSRVYCFGDNDNLQIATFPDTTDPHPTPHQSFSGAAVSVATGWDHACVTTTGMILCWGDNEHRQLALPNPPGDYGAPTTTGFPTTGTATALALGAEHTCALLGSREVYCWGFNDVGQVGTSAGSDVMSPSRVALTNVAAIGAGAHHTCAIHGGMLSCWGRGDNGRLGNEDTSSSASPVPVAVTNPIEVGGGARHTCARTGGGDIYCWGHDDKKQIGGGGDRDAPVRVTAIANAADLAVGGEHNCVIVAGEVWCWGRNNKDQLGSGGGDTGVPQLVPGLLVP